MLNWLTSARRISSLSTQIFNSKINVSSIMTRNLRIAVIGQSVFAKDVYNLIRKNGHTVVGVFTIPDKNGREVSSFFLSSSAPIFYTLRWVCFFMVWVWIVVLADLDIVTPYTIGLIVFLMTQIKFWKDPVATAAGIDGVPVFKFPGWRRKGIVKVNILVLHVSKYVMSDDLFTGRGPGAVQECGGGAQCYALLLTVYSAGGG